MSGLRSRDWSPGHMLPDHDTVVVDLEQVREGRRREAVRRAVVSGHPCAQHLSADDGDDTGEAS